MEVRFYSLVGYRPKLIASTPKFVCGLGGHDHPLPGPGMGSVLDKRSTEAEDAGGMQMFSYITNDY